MGALGPQSEMMGDMGERTLQAPHVGVAPTLCPPVLARGQCEVRETRWSRLPFLKKLEMCIWERRSGNCSIRKGWQLVEILARRCGAPKECGDQAWPRLCCGLFCKGMGLPSKS